MKETPKQNVIDLEIALRMREQHCTFQEIADHFGTSRQAIQQKLKRHDVKKEVEKQKHEG